MLDRADLIVRNGSLVSADAVYPADVAVAGGSVVAVAAPGTLGLDAAEVLDAAGQFVLPGVVDGHVHFREPGLEHEEDFESGSRAAVMGGVTTVLDMPNTLPSTSTADLVDQKRRAAEARSYCDVGLLGLLGQDNVDQVVPMARAGVVGYKCFLAETVGNIPPPDDGALLEALHQARAAGRRVGFHAENDAILRHLARRLKAEGRVDPLAHLDARPAIAEVEAIQRAALFAGHVGAAIHVCHLSSREGLASVEAWRARGVDVTCEVTPQHCFLTADDMRVHGAMLRINPPVRERGHGEALLRGLAEGRVDAIATDHSPHTLADKTRPGIWQNTSGFAGVETSLRLFLTYGVNAGRLSLPQYVRAACEGPARVWGLYPRKGTIRVGADADLTIVDLARTGTVAAARLHGKNNHGPWEGRATRGEAVATVVRGQVVMRDGVLVGEPRGRLVRPVAGLSRPA